MTLIDVLIDGFEKNEIMYGFHWRNLPMPTPDSAIAKYAALASEARRWKGDPLVEREEEGRRIIAWADLEIRQAGPGIMVRVRSPKFSDWWHARETWANDPMGPIYEWLKNDEATRRRTDGSS